MPFCHKFCSVGLGARAPHSRTFAAIKHAKLNGGAVGDNTHLATQSIYFAHYLTLGDATHGGVATHLGYLVHIHCDEQGVGAEIGCRASCFATCVSCTYHYHVVFKSHRSIALFGRMASASFSCISIISRSPGPLSLMPQRCSTPCITTRISSSL